MDARSSRMWRRRAMRPAVVGAVVAGVLATCSVVMVSPAAAADVVWNLDARKAAWSLDDFGDRLQRLCGVSSSDVRVRFRTPRGRFSLTFWCSTLPTTDEALHARLVNDVSTENDALAKAKRLTRLWSALLPDEHPYATDQATWYIATGSGNSHCEDGYRPKVTARQLAWSREHGEDAERWTLVEAIPLRVLCPERLDDLYAAVRAQGEAGAARAVRRQLAAVS